MRFGFVLWNADRGDPVLTHVRIGTQFCSENLRGELGVGGRKV